MTARVFSTFLILTFLSVSSSLSGDDGVQVDYLRDIKPLFVEKCASCHGPVKQEAGLRLDAVRFIQAGAESGPVAISGHPEKSLVLERVTAGNLDERMPPEGEGEPLTPEQLKLLSEWIRSGMLAPKDEEVLASPYEHWAYQKIVRPALPTEMEVIVEAKSHNPIDLLLAQKQLQGGLKTTDRATSEMLLRRVSLDVTGLPPTVKQLEEFKADPSQAHYESIVHQLLESPRYGERWGRHWMDVWRYSDWYGYKQELRGSQRHLWHWRDWIIESLNDDKSYDRMLVEMLAADEVAPLDQDALRATGFLARNFHNSNRNIWLDATVEHTAKAFLGMTLNCARCHDHKFDPIAQKEYYTFRAIFEPHNVRADRLSGQRDTNVDGLARVFDKEPEASTFLYQRGDEKFPDKEHPLEAGVVEILGIPFEVQPVDLPVESFFPALSHQVQNEDLERLQREFNAAHEAVDKLALANKTPAVSPEETQFPPAPALPITLTLEQQRASLKLISAESKLAAFQARYAADHAKYPSPSSQPAKEFEQLGRTAATAERQANWHAARLASFQKWQTLNAAQLSKEQDATKKQTAIEKARKELADARGDAVKKKMELSQTNSKYTSVGPVYPQQSTGRRTALANWIAHPDNPLTARVAVNHIWLRHFGTPLVDNVFDFGIRSPRPRHADLLDWLASEFIESGWSMKHLHRLIITSRTYQQSSTGTDELLAHNQSVDSDNKDYWRANVRRLESEVIRDSLLRVSNQLDTTMSGPDIDYSKGEDVPRRSVYFRHAIEKQMQMMTVFDSASPNECYRRSPSVIPQQALALANSKLSTAAARHLTTELNQSHPKATQFIKYAFMKILSREPSADELSACEQFLEKQTQLLSKGSSLTEVGSKTSVSLDPSNDPGTRARENLVHVLMNHNDFISVR